MKKYHSPMLECIGFQVEDILTSSTGDNDAPFIPPTSPEPGDNGWSGYH